MDWNMDKVKIGPLLTGQYSHVQLAAFSETGSTTPLSFPNQGQDSLVSQLGFQASREWKGGGVSFEPSLGASWEHVFQGNLSQITAGLGKAGNSFTVEGPALGTDGFLVSAGLKAQLSDGLSLQAQYEGLLGMTNVSSQSFGGGIGFGF
jgi:outer membrane autotransporter protein